MLVDRLTIGDGEFAVDVRRDERIELSAVFHFFTLSWGPTPTTCAFAASPLGIVTGDFPLSPRLHHRPHAARPLHGFRRSALLPATYCFHHDSITDLCFRTTAVASRLTPLGVVLGDVPLSRRERVASVQPTT